MDDRLKKNLDEKIIPNLEKADKDYILAMDGAEGSGKSTLAIQIGKYVDPTLNLSRIVFDGETFRQAIYKAKPGQCVIFDEAFTGLSSRSSLSSINTALVSLMMQMRQKNLFVILVLPTFFMLDKYAALFRTRALIHVYQNKGVRGYFRVYDKKKKKYLYLYGKKDYSYGAKTGKNKYVITRFKGRFYGVFALGDATMEKKYRAKKEKALEETQKNPISAGQFKYKEQRDKILYLFRKHTKKSYQEIEEILLDIDLDLSYVQIRNICIKFGDNQKLEEKKEKLKIKREAEELKEGELRDKVLDNGMEQSIENIERMIKEEDKENEEELQLGNEY